MLLLAATSELNSCICSRVQLGLDVSSLGHLSLAPFQFNLAASAASDSNVEWIAADSGETEISLEQQNFQTRFPADARPVRICAYLFDMGLLILTI